MDSVEKNLVTLYDVKKNYDGRCVLDVAELSLAPAHAYVLIGANGSGKTTLLRLLAGLEKPSAGRISRTIAREDAILCLQHPYLFRGSVQHNLIYGLKTRHHRYRETEVLALARRFHLDKLLSRDSRHLSAGETQRVALVRVLLCKPKLLLLDEPTANLDEHSQEVLHEILQAMMNEGRTAVIATHLPLPIAQSCITIRMAAGQVLKATAQQKK